MREGYLEAMGRGERREKREGGQKGGVDRLEDVGRFNK